MSNLPINWQDKENSPELQAYLAQFGRQFYIDANEANQVRDAINELAQGVYPDQFIAVNGFGFDGLTLKFQEDWAWRINGQSYSNPELVEVPFPLATAGKMRLDLVVATTSNTFMRVAGDESATTPFAPAMLPDTLYITTILVTDNSVSNPTPPVIGGNFQTKTEKATVIVAGGGGGFLSVSDEKATYDISSYGSPLQGLEDQQGFLYEGKEIIFRNTGTNPLTFVHDATSSANNKNYFTFPTELNLVLQPNESIVFQARGNGRLAYIGLKPLDISNKADLVGGFVPQSQLPSYVDDILEFPTLANFPATGESGKIYIAISPKNLQYRWSGSAYVAVTNGFISSTDDVPEGNNKYSTENRVLNYFLTGLSTLTNSSILNTDSIVAAFGKLQAQINALLTGKKTKTQP